MILRRKTPIQASSLGSMRLSRAEYARTHGADPADIKTVRAFAREYGLEIEMEAPQRRTMMLSGSVPAMQKAFAVELQHATVDGKTYRVREGGIQLPPAVGEAIVAVLGLDNRPQAKPHFRIRPAAQANSPSYTPVQVARLYGFPESASGKGQTIGLIELGGGYRTADLTAYFKTLGQPAPSVKAVSVDEGKNSPTTASGADGEVMLDIEVAGAVAPGAEIAVYFAPNTDQGFIDAVSTAVHDTTNKPGVISISWGGPESSWTKQALTALDEACQSAAAMGITITVAAGDNGSDDGVGDGKNHVDFPASSPHVLACGGTKLTASGGAIETEVVWNETAANEGATGGGVSGFFALPTWQSGAHVPAANGFAGRGVPDVAGDADPATGYIVRVDGQSMVIGGTSAVAPLWAGLIAVANAQNAAAAGFVQPAIYAAGARSAFRDITQGNNGAFSAEAGWDACTGLGSPMGAAIVTLLGKAGGAGVKRTKRSPAKSAAKGRSAAKTRARTR